MIAAADLCNYTCCTLPLAWQRARGGGALGGRCRRCGAGARALRPSRQPAECLHVYGSDYSLQTIATKRCLTTITGEEPAIRRPTSGGLESLAGDVQIIPMFISVAQQCCGYVLCCLLARRGGSFASHEALLLDAGHKRERYL